MGSTKKHKKHKTRRREKYEEFSNNVNAAKFHWGYKWHNDNCMSDLDVANDSIAESISPKSNFDGLAAISNNNATVFNDVTQERDKQYKSIKKRKDHMKSHKHHRERKMEKMSNDIKFENARCDGSPYAEAPEHIALTNNQDSQSSGVIILRNSVKVNETNSINGMAVPINIDGDSSRDSNSFIDDDNSQPLPENVLYYAGMTTENSPSCRPVSKPIRPRKFMSPPKVSPHHSQGGMNSSHIQSSINGSRSNIVTSSPSTSKSGDTPKTPNSSESGREPRTCVLKLKQQKSPLNKLLEHLLRVLEKRDPHQFFAWPVTDDIAPGYSRLISKPMDFSTIRQKIEDNDYSTLTEFTDDFRLMCENAIKYNHVDTVYHKAAKRLLQVGLKHLAPESLMRSLKPLSGYMRELTVKELGFELVQSGTGECSSQMIDSADEGASTGAEEATTQIEEDRTLQLKHQSKFRLRSSHINNKNDANSQENLSEGSITNLTSPTGTTTTTMATSAERLTPKEKPHKANFWRLNKDGSTSLNVLIKDENEGPEKVVDLGTLVGKLEQGTGQVHSYREDKRNEAKLVKPLHYGPYSSFAPTFDSRFATLNKEECKLIMQTYGDADSVENSLEYPIEEESYATILANGLLLNVFTNDKQDADYLEDLENFNNTKPSIPITIPNIDAERIQIEHEYEKYKNTRIDFGRLRTLSDLGIDVSFLDDIEKEMEHFELTRRLQEHLSNNYHLIDKLRTMQHERLSQPLPQHLALVPQASQEETQLANQITQQLRDVAKKLPPSAVTDPYSLRKAMGVSYVGLPTLKPQETCSPLPTFLQKPVTLPTLPLICMGSHSENFKEQQPLETNVPVSDVASIPMDIDGGDIPTIATMAITESDGDAMQHKMPQEPTESTENANIQTTLDSNATDNKSQL